MADPDFDDKDVRDRYLAIRAAGQGGDVAFLIGALRDPDFRAKAADYLADLRAVEATPSLLPLLDARDPHARTSAARALGELRASAALPKLREIAATDEQDFVRSWAVGAIGKIGGPDATELLITFLHDPSMRVRSSAALALGQRGDPSALVPLREARPRVHRSPFEWYLYRRLYRDAARSIRQGEARGIIARADQRP